MCEGLCLQLISIFFPLSDLQLYTRWCRSSLLFLVLWIQLVLIVVSTSTPITIVGTLSSLHTSQEDLLDNCTFCWFVSGIFTPLPFQKNPCTSEWFYTSCLRSQSCLLYASYQGLWFWLLDLAISWPDLRWRSLTTGPNWTCSGWCAGSGTYQTGHPCCSDGHSDFEGEWREPWCHISQIRELSLRKYCGTTWGEPSSWEGKQMSISCTPHSSSLCSYA